jgi:hypothetical protein
MALNEAALNAAINGLKTAAPYLSLHSATPDAAGSNAVGTRVAASWGTASNGDIVATNVAFTGLPASGSIVAVGLWSASSSGTYYGHLTLTGDTSANAAGEYTITSITLDID